MTKIDTSAEAIEEKALWLHAQGLRPEAAALRALAAENARLRQAGQDVLIATSMTSLPRKLDFARERGMENIEQVHEWMLAAWRTFRAAVEGNK